MKKLFLSLALIAGSLVCFSCADDLEAQEKVETRSNLTIIQQKALNYMYKFCVDNFSEELKQASYDFENPTNEEKISVIRFCDYCLDEKGDFLCEQSEYDEIREILWPNGFGEF